MMTDFSFFWMKDFSVLGLLFFSAGNENLYDFFPSCSMFIFPFRIKHTSCALCVKTPLSDAAALTQCQTELNSRTPLRHRKAWMTVKVRSFSVKQPRYDTLYSTLTVPMSWQSARGRFKPHWPAQEILQRPKDDLTPTPPPTQNPCIYAISCGWSLCPLGNLKQMLTLQSTHNPLEESVSIFKKRSRRESKSKPRRARGESSCICLRT